MRFKWAAVVVAAILVLGGGYVAMAQEEISPEVQKLVDDGLIKKVTPEEVNGMIGQGEAGAVVDVRTAEEYGAGRLPGAISVPSDALEAKIAEAVADKAAAVCVYGASGAAGATAAAQLYALGYTAVSYMDGGYAAWTAAGYPVEQ